MPIKHFFVSIWIIIVISGVVALGVVFPPITIFLPGVMAFAISFPMYYVFKKYTEEEIDPIEAKVFSFNKNQNANEKGTADKKTVSGKTTPRKNTKSSKKDNVF